MPKIDTSGDIDIVLPQNVCIFNIGWSQYRVNYEFGWIFALRSR